MATDADQQVNEHTRSSRSSLSIQSQEDWDQLLSDNKSGSRPTTPKAGAVANGTRRLAELLKHAEDGTEVELTPEDEAQLGEELAAWVNEPDDDWFQQKAHEIRARRGTITAGTA